MGDLKSAEENHKTALVLSTTESQKSQALINIANIQFYQKNYVNAIETYLECLRISQNNYEVCYSLGNCYILTQKYSEAIDYYTQALKQLKNFEQPVISEIYYNLGNAYSSQEKFKESIKYYIKSLKIDASSPETFYNLGNSQFMNKQFNEALLSYESSEKLGGKSSQLTLLKIRTLIEIEENKETNIAKAEKLINRLLKEEKANENVLYVYGNLMENKGNKEKALEFYEVIIILLIIFNLIYLRYIVCFKDKCGVY